jgi:hypothetical protein
LSFFKFQLDIFALAIYIVRKTRITMQNFSSVIYLHFDTEFANFHNLSALSIGIVSEDKSLEFYKEVSDFDINSCSQFVKDVIIPLMDISQHGLPYKEVSKELIKWINSLPCKEVIFVSDYPGDITILERLISLQGELKLEKKVMKKLIDKAFNQAVMERGLYNHQHIHKAFKALTDGIDRSLAKQPHMRHHALYDAHANCDGWNDAMKVLKAL